MTAHRICVHSYCRMETEKVIFLINLFFLAKVWEISSEMGRISISGDIFLLKESDRT